MRPNRLAGPANRDPTTLHQIPAKHRMTVTAQGMEKVRGMGKVRNLRSHRVVVFEALLPCHLAHRPMVPVQPPAALVPTPAPYRPEVTSRHRSCAGLPPRQWGRVWVFVDPIQRWWSPHWESSTVDHRHPMSCAAPGFFEVAPMPRTENPRNGPAAESPMRLLRRHRVLHRGRSYLPGRRPSRWENVARRPAKKSATVRHLQNLRDPRERPVVGEAETKPGAPAVAPVGA